MKQSKTTIKELTKRYRAVLLKCALLNAAAFAIAFSANAAPLTVEEGQSVTPEAGTYDYISVNGGTLTLNNDEFETLRDDNSSLTNGRMSLSGALLDMNSPEFAINNSTLTIDADSQIAGRAITIDNGSELTLNSTASQISLEADSITINDSTVSMSGGGYGLVASFDNGISITGASTINANSTNIAYTVSEDGNAVSNSKLKIGGTSVFNVNGNVKVEAVTVDGENVSFETGKILFSGGTINLNGGLTADIDATGGTIAFNNDNAVLNGTLTGTIDALNISGGTIENQEFFVSGDATISGGTFTGTADMRNLGTGTVSGRIDANNLTISGGTFTGEEYLKDIDTTTIGICANRMEDRIINISGGTFSGGIDLFGDFINISGGTFSGVYMQGVVSISIDSDNAAFLPNTKISKNTHITTSSLNITGNRGISVSDTYLEGGNISGKIIANENSFVRGYAPVLQRINFNGKSAYAGAYLPSRELDVSFNAANITLNKNAQAGVGNAMWEYDIGTDGYLSGERVKTVRQKLTENEINESVEFIVSEVRKVNDNGGTWFDLPGGYHIGWPLMAGGTTHAIGELDNDDFAHLEQSWRSTYSDYNDALDGYSADVMVTDSTITMNDTAALANYSIADDEKGNITVNNSTVTVNGTNTISAAEGDISFTNASTLAVGNGATSNIVSKNNNTVAFDNTSTLDLAGRLNGNVSVNNSTILFKNGATLNGTLTGTIGTLNISGGTFENQEFTVSGDATISGGTFSKDAYIVSSNTIAISGGALFTPGTGFETELEANDITVSGGTFNGAMDWEADNNMTISGGTFNSSRIEFEAGNTLEIDSDGVSLTRTTGTTPFIFKAGTQINVTGTTGLATTETVVASSLISGKIIANNQSFIGNVGNAVNKWTFGNNTVYSVTPDAFGTDTAFNEANLTLNGNAIAGSGNYIWEIAGSGASDITAVSLTPVQNKLTADEINNSVTLTMAEIRRINSSQTKNSDDMLDVYEDVWDDIPWPASSYGLQDFVIGKWESGTALTEDELDDVEDVLRAAYSSYNTALNTYSADVTVTNSTITMNGTSALANYSIADDEKGNITVDHSTVTANGTNTISALKGEISFENNSALTVSNGAVLSIVSKNDNTVSFDATSGLNVNGTVNGNIAFAGANGKVKANNGTVRGTLSVAENTVLDMSGNSQIDALNVDKLISANGKLAIDIDAARKVADTLTVGAESSGTLTISALNGIQAGQDFSVEVLKGAGVGNITLALSDELTAEYGSEQERHETRTENLKADSAWTDTYGAFDWIITEEQQLAVNGGKVTYSSSVTEQKGEALDTQDTLMLVNTNATLSAKSFKTTDAQAEYAATADLGETKGAVTVSGAKDGNAVSTIALGNHSGFIVNSGATLKLDSVRITGDNGVLTVGSGATVSLNNIVLEGSVTNNGTLDIGESTLVATNISGGILKATLTDAAKTSAIVTADAENVTLALDMSKAARGDEATLYHVTDGTGFTFGEYDTRRYAVSTASFDKNAAKEMAVLGNWTGGDLYIMKLATAGEAAVEDLKNIGVPVSATEEKAIEVLNDEVIEKLAPSQKAAVQKINDLLDTLAGNVAQIKQVLREVAPEAAPSASQTASSNAGAVISVVGTRMGGGSPAPAAGSGRSGGDYTAGAGSVWAQGMYNKAKLDKTDGFDSDSTGFAAGFEYAFNDSVKAGVGYAYTTTDIDTDRSKTDVDTHTGFVYGEYKPDNFYVNSVLSYGHSKYDETTRLAGLKSDYRANTFAGQIMSGYTFGFLTPEAGLRYTSVRQRSYTNALGAQMASKTLDTWTGVAGLKASKSFRSGKTTITPDAKLALTYDFKRDGQARTVTLANGSSYVAEGDNMKRFGVELGAGVSVKVGNNTDIGLSYEGKFKDHYTDHTGLINVKYNF